MKIICIIIFFIFISSVCFADKQWEINDLITICFLLDETGSMSSQKSETIKSFNSYLKELKEKNKIIEFTLYRFNSKKFVSKISTELDVLMLNEDDYLPENMTPLYDAMAKAIIENKNKNKILFVVFTDGLENDSTEYKLNDLKNLINEQKEKNWTFLYLGMHLDAWKEGGQNLQWFSTITGSEIQIGCGNWASCSTVKGGFQILNNTTNIFLNSK